MNSILEQSTVMEGVDGKPDHQILLSIGQSFSPRELFRVEKHGVQTGFHCIPGLYIDKNTFLNRTLVRHL